MKVTKIEATPLETITVAGEEVRVEWTGVETYKVVIDGKEEISTKWHFERCIEYWEKQKAEHIAKCDAEIEKCNAILIEITKTEVKTDILSKK
jgi:hypothetical protein